MADQTVTPVDRVSSMLEDDAYRSGGAVEYGALLRLAEKFCLGAADIVAVRARLNAAGIEIEGDPDAATDTVATDDTTESSEPSASALDSLGVYLRDAAKFNLLKPHEETALARRIRAGERAAKALSEGCADPDGALEKIRQDGLDARDRFLKANLRLVMYVAKQYARQAGPLSFEDLVQEGNLGLMKAIERFDHNRGFKFSTYALWWIRQTITRAMADKKELVRVPVHVQELARKVRKTRKALTREHGGRQPSLHELAEHLGLPPEKVQFLLDLNKSPISLDSPLKEGETATVGDTLVNTSVPDPHEVTFLRERQRELDSVIAQLNPREQEVVRLRFGLEMTLEQVGQRFDVTRERIRQIERKALVRLRHKARAIRLRELIDFVPDDEGEETAKADVN